MTGKTIRLLLSNYTTREKKAHFARTILSETNIPELHTHDFHEVFWIEKGEGWHHINGRKISLKAGSLCFIRSTDTHGFTCKTGSRLTIANIAFPSSTTHHLLSRYTELSEYLGHKALLPRTIELDPGKLLEISRASQFLGEDSIPLVRAEWFLTGLPVLLRPADTLPESSDMPEWLIFACQKIKSGKAFQGGTPALVRFSGRTPEHVARTLRKLRGRTPTDVVNEARIEYCANALATTEEKITQIALEAGFQNLGHFYHVFRKTHGMSPRKYRLRQRSIFRGKS